MATSELNKDIIDITGEIQAATEALKKNSINSSFSQDFMGSVISNSSYDNNSEYNTLLYPNYPIYPDGLELSQIKVEEQKPMRKEVTETKEASPIPRKKSPRLYWADCARIFSMLCIVLLHSSGYSFERRLMRRKDSNWKYVCFINCLTRFSVPMFVLLSGTFILDPSRKFTFKKLFCHNIFRLTTAFFFWSTVNALINIFVYGKNNFNEFAKLFFVGEEYLWFIFMIIGCYLISPFLRYFSDDVVMARYFLGLCVFWGSLVPTLSNVFETYKFKDAKTELDTWTSRWHYHFTLEFVGYFVAGYHIVKHVNIKSRLIRVILYILAILDVAFIYSMTSTIEEKYVDQNSDKYSKDFRDNYTITIAYYTIVLFIFFKHEIGSIQFSRRSTRIISTLSSLTFGVYLTHMIVKSVLARYFSTNQTKFFGIPYSPVIGVPVFWIIITVISFLISYGLSKVPILKNYVL